MEYIFRRTNQESLRDISVLYEDCFSINVTPDQLFRKYNTSHFGLMFTGYLAYHKNEEVAAYYGVFPILANIKGKTILVGQSGDTMTAGNHRKKGLFVLLAKETYQLAESNGMKFVFGFPNENSLPGFERKLGWEFYGKMQRFEINGIKVIPLCEFAFKFKSIKGLYNSYLNNQLKKYRINSDELHFSNENMIVRDAIFFKYKLQNSENIEFIKFNGFKLVIKTSPHLMIGDVEIFQHNRVEEFIQTLSTLAKKVKANRVQLCVSENHWLFPVLSSTMKPEPSLPIGFYPMDRDISISEMSFTLLDYDTF